MADLGSMKPKANFTSYLKEFTNGATDDTVLQPKLLPGELEVITANNVMLFAAPGFSRNDSGISGMLVVTNFKLSFVTVQTPDANASIRQESTYLGPNDVTLANVDSVYQITDRKRRQILPNTKISSKLQGIHVVCKNFRVLKFGLVQCNVGVAKNVAEALVKFAFPSQHSLLFSYHYSEKYYNTLRNVSMFNTKADWTHELLRCGAIGWRVLSLEREDNMPSGTLPMHFVIPKSMKEADYLRMTNYFRDNRAAIWVFSLDNASLVRMAELMPTITDSQHENTMLEYIRVCDPSRRQPHILELSKCLPSIQDVFASYTKLKELCTPDSTRKFLSQDQRFYGLLDKSCWLLYVSLCLKHASESAMRMRSGETVVLQECDGRDMCCVLSSLVQVLLDPITRTIHGFQSLVQKEWVALGHPFSDRMGHVINNATSEQSPLLLLFLDCVWQLIQQFPADFEYTETYLTSVWDSVFMPVFDTFLFNSEHDRSVAIKNDQVVLRPAWDWGEQFADKDIQLFSNPIYKRTVDGFSRQSMAAIPPSAVRLPGLAGNRMTVNLSTMLAKEPSAQAEIRFLEPLCHIRDLSVWQQCYYRWLPILDVPNGGQPQIDLYHRIVHSNVSKLQQALQSRDFDDLPTPTNDAPSSFGQFPDTAASSNAGCPRMPEVSSFFPFGSASADGRHSNELADLFSLHQDPTEGSIFDGLSQGGELVE